MKLKVPYKYQKITNKLLVLKQDKGRCVTILDCKDHIQKYVSILYTSQFQTTDTEPTKSLEIKVQGALQKLSRFEENEFRKVYPTDSRVGVFYGTPKVHKPQQ